uniref:Uncharacterized protein n=1 Tax=Aegilops tauschii TaxID=37682 RepID=N1R049_AEGTA
MQQSTGPDAIAAHDGFAAEQEKEATALVIVGDMLKPGHICVPVGAPATVVSGFLGNALHDDLVLVHEGERGDGDAVLVGGEPLAHRRRAVAATEAAASPPPSSSTTTHDTTSYEASSRSMRSTMSGAPGLAVDGSFAATSAGDIALPPTEPATRISSRPSSMTLLSVIGRMDDDTS